MKNTLKSLIVYYTIIHNIMYIRIHKYIHVLSCCAYNLPLQPNVPILLPFVPMYWILGDLVWYGTSQKHSLDNSDVASGVKGEWVTAGLALTKEEPPDNSSHPPADPTLPWHIKWYCNSRQRLPPIAWSDLCCWLRNLTLIPACKWNLWSLGFQAPTITWLAT